MDFRVIRGLGYYTGLVFEAWSKVGINRALFGGGRYNDLTTLVGSTRSLPGVGFAVGDVAITELIKDRGLDIENRSARPDLLITTFDAELESTSIQAAALFRKTGLKVAVFPDVGKKLAKQFDYARKSSIPFVGVIGPDEKLNGSICIKNMDSGDQKTGSIEKMAQELASAEKLLGPHEMLMRWSARRQLPENLRLCGRPPRLAPWCTPRKVRPLVCRWVNGLECRTDPVWPTCPSLQSQSLDRVSPESAPGLSCDGAVLCVQLLAPFQPPGDTDNIPARKILLEIHVEHMREIVLRLVIPSFSVTIDVLQ